MCDKWNELIRNVWVNWKYKHCDICVPEVVWLISSLGLATLNTTYSRGQMLFGKHNAKLLRDSSFLTCLSDSCKGIGYDVSFIHLYHNFIVNIWFRLPMWMVDKRGVCRRGSAWQDTSRMQTPLAMTTYNNTRSMDSPWCKDEDQCWHVQLSEILRIFNNENIEN